MATDCLRNSAVPGGMMLCASWQSAQRGALEASLVNTRLPWNDCWYILSSAPWQSPQALILAVCSQPWVTLAGCMPALKPMWQLMHASWPWRELAWMCRST